MVMRAISTTAGALRVWPAPATWTYEDYAQLPDDGYRYEVFEGDLLMSPAPTTDHQDAVIRLSTLLFLWVKATGAGRVLTAPCDVVFAPAVVVQPDILFVAADRTHLIGPQNIAGAPDLVVEIVSPSDPDYDRVRKHELYARHGVREYWIVDPVSRTIEVFVLGPDGYGPALRSGSGETARSNVLVGFAAAVDDVMPAAE